jgi:chromate transport protein ChrA
MAILRLLASLSIFVGILVGCVAALLLVVVLLRFPLLLIAALLTCWIFSRLWQVADKPPD